MIVSYIRVSSQGQVDGDGPLRQRDSLARFAPVQEFSDEGVSGTLPLSERPGLLEALQVLATAPDGEERVLVVEKADRLARDLVEGELILRECRRRGVRVVEADSGADLTAGGGSPTATLIRQVLGAVAEFEKNALVSKLRAARNRIRATTGRCGGRRPPPTEMVEMARTLHAEGMSYRNIARHLEDLGYGTRKSSTIARWCGRVLA